MRLTVLAATGLAAFALTSGALAQVNGPAPCTNGTARLAGVTYTCRGVDLLSVVPTGVEGPLRTSAMNDIWGWTDPQTGREYALGGTRSGVVFVDVTTPTAPLVIGKLPTQTDNSPWRDVKTRGNFAFVVSEAPGHGMQVFDLTRLRGLAPDATRDFTADVVYRGFGSAHNVVVNEATGFAYGVGSAVTAGASLPAACTPKGFHAVNIQNPLQPTFAGCFSDASVETGPRSPGYTHDAQCVVYAGPDRDYTGREVCIASNEDVLTVFDVTNKAAVRIVSQGRYPAFSYTHQAWFTADQRYALLDDELDEQTDANAGRTPNQRTLVMNLADLDNPEFAFEYRSGLTTIDHNLYTLGRYAFESNYESGLRIVDLSGIENRTITETAFFDTYPQSTTAQFNGNWSNYPYFASGIVVASDINNGLFVLRPTTLLTAEAPAPSPGVGYAITELFPNPAAQQSRLSLSVDAAQAVTADVYDLTGRRVATAFSGPAAPGGALDIDIDTSALAPGVYVVRIAGETFSASRRLVVAR